MNIFLALAAALSALVALTHLFLGGRSIARPLLQASDLHDVAKYTNYYCWHLVTITLFAMAAAFAWAAAFPEARALAVCWTVLAALFGIWNFALAIWKKQSLLHMPQWILFLGVSVPAFLGVL